MLLQCVVPDTYLACTLNSANDGHNMTVSFDNIDAAVIAPDHRTSPQLSPRETSILRCLVEGDSNKCIARKINIAEATVKVHIKAILRKIRVQNRTQAAIWGMNNGSVIRLANDSSPPSISDMSGRIHRRVLRDTE